MVKAQAANSTQYDGMPRSAVATGVVDSVLPPEDMPAQLISYVSHAFGAPGPGGSASGLRIDDALKKIFVLLRSRTGHDFSLYKQNTVSRRVERRMAVHQIERLDDYVQYLRKNPLELDALFRDFLIGVTHFFRDAEPFEVLKQEGIVRILSNKPSGGAVRVWVPGCSTGEEAYSIAMLLQERMEMLKTHFKLTVFATDIDSRAIEHARAGIYPNSIASDVSAERRNRFFTEEPGGEFFRVNKLIRDILVFSEQSIVKDPPFSRLDLISCRNLLIYMGGELHKKLIPMFHYALNPGGILFLGTSESVGDHLQLFDPLNRIAKLYQRKDVGLPQRLSMTRFLPSLNRRDGATRPGGHAPEDSKAQLRTVAERILLKEYGPVGALVDDRGDILYLHGRTGDYLEPAPGEAGMNIMKMARPGLRHGLTTALHKAVGKREAVTQHALGAEKNGDLPRVDIKIWPVASDVFEQPLFMVTFEPALLPDAEALKDIGGDISRRGAATRAKEINTQIDALKQQLRDKDEYLQTTTEELETSNEELKSANEEMQSINEEMQSTNEELETSKEELQSVNEELITVNTELQDKLNDLAKANNDMNNLLAGSGVGTIFVNHQQYIQRFTPAITQVINLIASDVGRPVGHISSNLLGYTGLVKDIQSVLDTLVPKEIEVESVLGRWFTLHIRPYRTLENVIEGAVITFSDITETKKARAILMETETLRRLATVMTDSRDAILVQNLDGKIIVWNAAATRIYGWTEVEALAMNIRDLIPEKDRDAALERVRQLGEAAVLQPYQMGRICKNGRIVLVSLAAVALVNEAGEVYAISTTERAST